MDFFSPVPLEGIRYPSSERFSFKPNRLTAKTSRARVSPFMDIRDAGGLLQRSGFSLPMVSTETLTVHFDSAYDLFLDLRGMGESNTLLSRRRQGSSRALFEDAAQAYHEKFQTEDGKIFASFEILYLSGWAPDPTQPRPLPRGSAQTSLKDFLKQR